ncbi:hypothetical protein B0H10DRAFT_2233864 [Mycena sp. CBHHK59/15]|nr:hypothetical protein B0H10DRAFT_2233864 [Mycena sp. CBHHK59/15]
MPDAKFMEKYGNEVLRLYKLPTKAELKGMKANAAETSSSSDEDDDSNSEDEMDSLPSPRCFLSSPPPRAPRRRASSPLLPIDSSTPILLVHLAHDVCESHSHRRVHAAPRLRIERALDDKPLHDVAEDGEAHDAQLLQVNVGHGFSDSVNMLVGDVCTCVSNSTSRKRKDRPVSRILPLAQSPSTISRRLASSAAATTTSSYISIGFVEVRAVSSASNSSSYSEGMVVVSLRPRTVQRSARTHPCVLVLCDHPVRALPLSLPHRVQRCLPRLPLSRARSAASVHARGAPVHTSAVGLLAEEDPVERWEGAVRHAFQAPWEEYGTLRQQGAAQRLSGRVASMRYSIGGMRECIVGVQCMARVELGTQG